MSSFSAWKVRSELWDLWSVIKEKVCDCKLLRHKVIIEKLIIIDLIHQTPFSQHQALVISLSRWREYKSLTLPLSAGETAAPVWSRFQAWLKQEVKRWSIAFQPPLFGGFSSPCGTVTCRRRQPPAASPRVALMWMWRSEVTIWQGVFFPPFPPFHRITSFVVTPKIRTNFDSWLWNGD